MPAKSSRSAERRYRKMLRESLAATSPESGVAAAAGSAIGALSVVAGRRDRGEAVSQEYLARFSTGSGQTTASPSRRESTGRTGRWFAIAAALVACAAAAVVMPNWLRTAPTVSGTILVNRTPVAGVDVVFHLDAGDAVARATTGTSGEFLVRGIAPGDYTVFLQADDGDRVPPAYRSPESSPFRLHVERDLENLQFFAVSQPSSSSRP